MTFEPLLIRPCLWNFPFSCYSEIKDSKTCYINYIMMTKRLSKNNRSHSFLSEIQAKLPLHQTQT